MSRFDGVVEGLSRRLAGRLTRRSFLDRAGRVGVLVASGPVLATLLSGRAEARVCGQSGVAPKCATFDCHPPDVWGWCWYASPGCCSNGGLKKICDCCRFAHPFVHGYCPSGYNVLCIVESCHADPRVMPVAVHRLSGMTAAAVAAQRSHVEAGRGGASTMVLADAGSAYHAAVAGPLAAAHGAPLLLTGSNRLAGGAVAEIQRLGVRRVLFVGEVLSGAVRDDLASYGVDVDGAWEGRVESVSVEVAREVIDRTGARRAFAVGVGGVSGAAAPAAGAAAAALGSPLLVGIEAAQEATDTAGVVLTYLVGPEMSGRAGELAGGWPLRSPSPAALAREIGAVVVDVEGVAGLALTMVPEESSGLATGATAAGLALFHPDGVMGPENVDFVADRRSAFRRGLVVGTVGRLGTGGVYDLQSALNGFETRRLVGVAGQGLPVISQPLPERELGQARVGSAPPAAGDDGGSYWVSRANPDRR